MKKEQRKRQNTLLGTDANQGIQKLILMSKKLSSFADQEMQALAMGDVMRFAYLQQDKDKAASDYADASREFRSRLEDFRGADKGLLAQLEKLQVELKQKAENNNTLIGQIRDRAHANTKSTLFSAQELGQRVSFNTTRAYAATQKESAR